MLGLFVVLRVMGSGGGSGGTSRRTNEIAPVFDPNPCTSSRYVPVVDAVNALLDAKVPPKTTFVSGSVIVHWKMKLEPNNVSGFTICPSLMSTWNVRIWKGSVTSLLTIWSRTITSGGG